MTAPTTEGVSIRHRIAMALMRAHLAEQIITMRQERNWTQKQLAKKSGLSVTQIVRLEDHWGRLPRISTLEKIATAFDVALVVAFSSWKEFADLCCNKPTAPAPFSFDPGLAA